MGRGERLGKLTALKNKTITVWEVESRRKVSSKRQQRLAEVNRTELESGSAHLSALTFGQMTYIF